MQFTKLYFELRTQFKPESERIDFDGSSVTCNAFRFNSYFPTDLYDGVNDSAVANNKIFEVPDASIIENQLFTYYVFTPDKQDKYKRAIILLHGLNERSWVKYLAWAYYLTKKTGHPVILFPIAFHMNRSPEAWGNPRMMQPLQGFRTQKYGYDSSSTFANVALSERLTSDPLRFFTSGQQSAADLVKLCRQIRTGNHPLFDNETTTDVFAYSIGAFLAQIIFIANQDELFSNSKLFLFCGGAFFNEMNGVSRLIMDKVAFSRLRSFYIDELNIAQKGTISMAETMSESKRGQAFLSMLAPELMQSFRENRFREMSNNMKVIALKNDSVIPANKVANSLGKYTDVETLDFPFEYSHEMSFPYDKNTQPAMVDAAFEKVFCRAGDFLL
jgi:hypothetical protein